MNATADLEREGDELRADMDRTLNRIERELSPDKLMDRSMEFFREHGGDFVKEAGATVRNNPVPVLLTAVGVIWLTAAVASSRSTARGRSHIDRSHIDEDMESFGDFAEGQDYAGDGNGERRFADRFGRTPGFGREQKGREQKSHLMRLVREQPIALGAVALAAGALLGAALPMTDYENRLMGAAARARRNRKPDESASAPLQTNAGSTSMIDE